MVRFTFLGFPVRVDWTFWLVSALMSGAIGQNGREMFLQMALWIAAVFVSILWHELGHAQAHRKYGGDAEILLYSMGGLCIGRGHNYYTRQQDMWISFAGPGASIFLFGVSLAAFWFTPLPQSSRYAGIIISNLLWINGFWTLVNLLPVMPLDGGQILRAFMANKNPSIVPKVGMIVAALVGIAGFYYVLFFSGIFFLYLAHSNWQRMRGTHGGFW